MKEISNWLEQMRSLPYGDLLLQLAQFILWVVLILFFSWLVNRAINRSVKDNSVRYKSKKVSRFISYVLIVLLAIISFTGKIQYFTLAIGLISAGLAFALQEIIMSLAGSAAIFSSNMYKPGDRIEINGCKGDVIDIGLTKTTLMEIGGWVGSDNYSGRIVQISNAFVFRGPVSNYSTNFPFVWDEINIPIHYESDTKLVNEIITSVADRHLTEYAKYAKTHWAQMTRKYLIEDARVEPSLTFALTDNWIGFNLRYVVDYKKRRSIRHRLYSDILQRIRETDGKVTLASSSIALAEVPEIKVELRKGGEGTGG